MNVLDLVGVAAIGMLGALAVRGIQSKPAGDRVNQIMSFFGLSDWSFQFQAGSIAIFAGSLLIFRTVFSVIFQRRLLRFLSRCSSELARNLVSKYFSLNLTKMKELPPQDILYSVTTGTDALTVRLLGSVINMISDLFLLILMCLGLFVVSPAIAVLTILGFGSTGLILHLKMRKSAEKISRENAYLKIETSEKFLETASSIRELKVQNRVGFFFGKFK
jgi:ATP-binding cassette subfamily C protein